ncbi:hypothetical protein Tco_0245190, partial [Tanacetum coccineum]
VWVMGLVKYLMGVCHYVVGPTNGNEVGEDVVGLVEIVSDDLGVDLGEVAGTRTPMEVFQDFYTLCDLCMLGADKCYGNRQTVELEM